MPRKHPKNRSLYYETRGKGHPLLLIAGLGSDNSSWAGISGKLAKCFQVITFDNRGSGRSGAPGRRYTIRLMADDAKNLLERLGIKKCHVIGHSMGGYIAQELAINYPDRVGKLILAGTAGVSSRRNNILFEDFYKQLKKEGPSEAWFEKWAHWLFPRTLFTRGSFVRTFIKNSIKYPYLQKTSGFKGQMEAIMSFDSRGRTGAIKAKTLVLEGQRDILITPKEAKALAKGIPGSKFKLLEGMAHSMHIENPRLFTSSVLEFLKS